MKKPGWQEVIDLCRHAQSDQQLKALFGLLFTLDEQEQLITRVQLLRALLQAEKPQRAIAEELKISIAKITRGSNALKTIDADLRGFLEKELL